MSELWALIFWGMGAWHLVMGAVGVFHLRWGQRLPALVDLNPPESKIEEQPFVSVVVAARDEEARIEATVKRLLTQQGVRLEIIVANDRSSDKTGEILTRLTKEDQRVRVTHITALPAGWLGKCHACHQAASVATGEWILFTDADCWMKPDVVARALAVAAREKADHITLTPGVAPETLPARAWHLAFLFSLGSWFARVNGDRPGGHLGIGAFNLMRASAYRECGGYEALRMTVVDDVKLGLLLHRAGKRTRAFIGGSDVECHWGTTVRNIVHIMEKNYFAVLNYRTATATSLVIIGMSGWTISFIGPLTGTWPGMFAGLGLLAMAIPAAVVAGRLGWPRWYAVLMPYIFPALFYAIARSTFVTLRQDGVRWRETFYPLTELRKGNVE